jgi:hypothetical protein
MMHPMVLLSLLALEPSPPAPAAPARSTATPARWLPTLTLRFTHRDVRSLTGDMDMAATPLGTTLELRLVWGFSPATPFDP